MDDKIMLGEFIYTLRREKGYSQSELGEMLGVTNKAVSKWETLEANPEVTLILPLAEALGVTADELLHARRNDTQQDTKTDTQPDAVLTRFFGVKGKETRETGRYEFVSDKKTLKGTPYLHIHFGKQKDGKFCRARGVFAVGSNATGIVSLGIVAKGIVSTGVFSLGIVSFGVLAISLIALGLFNVGLLVAVGAVAVGLGVSVGGVAVGSIAVGGVAVGILSVGGVAIGLYAHTGADGIARGLHTFFH